MDQILVPQVNDCHITSEQGNSDFSTSCVSPTNKRPDDGTFKITKKGAPIIGTPFLLLLSSPTYPILFKSGTMSRETMLMILIIGLTAGPAVSL